MSAVAAEQDVPPEEVWTPVVAAEWSRGDPAPDRSVRAVVDEFGVTWSRDDLLAEGIRGWQQRLLTWTPGVFTNPTKVAAGVVAPSFVDIFRVVSGPLRLASAREASRWMERWLPDGEVRPRVG